MTSMSAGTNAPKYSDESALWPQTAAGGSALEVVVQREWNGWRTGLVRVTDLMDVHWRQPKGAPRPLIHGYVRCTDVVSGSLPHDPAGSPHPHRLLVCVVKCHVAPHVYERLAACASAAPPALDVDDRADGS